MRALQPQVTLGVDPPMRVAVLHHSTICLVLLNLNSDEIHIILRPAQDLDALGQSHPFEDWAFDLDGVRLLPREGLSPQEKGQREQLSRGVEAGASTNKARSLAAASPRARIGSDAN